MSKGYSEEVVKKKVRQWNTVLLIAFSTLVVDIFICLVAASGWITNYTTLTVYLMTHVFASTFCVVAFWRWLTWRRRANNTLPPDGGE